jgi:hypothetical protein
VEQPRLEAQLVLLQPEVERLALAERRASPELRASTGLLLREALAALAVASRLVARRFAA